MATNNPKWWNNDHDSAWQRTKEAIKRDWEQTKADLTGGGRDLNQDLSDTVKQATGSAPIPPRNTPNAPDAGDLKRQARKASRWEDVEDPVRYGYGAGRHYQGEYAQSEGELRQQWSSSNPGGNWDDVADHVRYGWTRARNNG